MKLPATFAAKVRTSDCLVWIGATNSKGYGVLIVDGKHHLAHRLAYEVEHGSIPDSLVIDHLCRVRNCVNTRHLEAVTQEENNRRGRRARSLQAGDTCNNGHLVSAADLYDRANGTTECHHCRRSSSHHSKSGARPTTQRRAPQTALALEAHAERGGDER